MADDADSVSLAVVIPLLFVILLIILIAYTFLRMMAKGGVGSKRYKTVYILPRQYGDSASTSADTYYKVSPSLVNMRQVAVQKVNSPSSLLFEKEEYFLYGAGGSNRNSNEVVYDAATLKKNSKLLGGHGCMHSPSFRDESARRGEKRVAFASRNDVITHTSDDSSGQASPDRQQSLKREPWEILDRQRRRSLKKIQRWNSDRRHRSKRRSSQKLRASQSFHRY